MAVNGRATAALLRGFRVATTLVALALGSCVTAGEGERIQGDVAKLRERVEVIETRDVEATQQLARLRKVLDQATALLTRNSADVGARVAKSETDIALLTGKIEEAAHLLEQLQKRLGEDGTRLDGRLAALEQGQQKIVDRVAPSMPEDKDALWKEAQSRLAGGMRDDARRFFRSFLQRFPQDPRAPEAGLQIGRSFAVDGKHTQAAAEYQKVLDGYAKAPEVPEAMWLLGESFVELKFCSDARVLLQDLAKRYPKAARANDAKQKIRDLTKIMKDQRLCTS